MDIAKSNTIFNKEIIDMVKGKRLDKEDVKQAFTIILTIILQLLILKILALS